MDFSHKEEKNIENNFHHPVGMLDRDQRTIKGFKPKIITQNDIKNIYNHNNLHLHRSYHCNHQHHQQYQKHQQQNHQHPQQQQQIQHQQQQLLHSINLTNNSDIPNNMIKNNSTWYMMATNNNKTVASTIIINKNTTTKSTMNKNDYILNNNKSDNTILKQHLNNDKCTTANATAAAAAAAAAADTIDNDFSLFNKNNQININKNKLQHKKVHSNYFNNRKQNNSYLILIIYITFELLKLSGNIVAAAPHSTKMENNKLEDKLKNPCNFDSLNTSPSPTPPTTPPPLTGEDLMKTEFTNLFNQVKVSLDKAAIAFNNFTLAVHKVANMGDWKDHEAPFLKVTPINPKSYDSALENSHLDEDNIRIKTKSGETEIDYKKWLSNSDIRLQRFVIGFNYIIKKLTNNDENNLKDVFALVQNETLTVLCEIRIIRHLIGTTDAILKPVEILPDDTQVANTFNFIVFREYVNELQYMFAVATKILEQFP